MCNGAIDERLSGRQVQTSDHDSRRTHITDSCSPHSPKVRSGQRAAVLVRQPRPFETNECIDALQELFYFV